jgi:cytochrome c-type biogenesis protein CcmF
MAALLTRKLDTGWIHAMRRWMLVSWLFLGIGITLGMWWAYVELGWGGYWAWDPVENASLLPWLTMTAFLHSVMIQEKRGMLKRWNLSLVVGTFLLSIFGTFITRSGVIASVHSFTQSEVGYYFLPSCWWPASSASRCCAPAGTNSSRRQAESTLSREALPLQQPARRHRLPCCGDFPDPLRGGANKITVGPLFNRVNVPFGLPAGPDGHRSAHRPAQGVRREPAVAVPPRSAGPRVAVVIDGMRTYRHDDRARRLRAGTVQEFYRGVRARHRMHGESVVPALFNQIARNRRRYGGYIVHVGILLMFIAFTGMAFRVDQEATLKPGESVEMKSPYGGTYKLTHLGVSQYNALNRVVSRHGAGGLRWQVARRRRSPMDSPAATFEPSTGSASGAAGEDLYIV